MQGGCWKMSRINMCLLCLNKCVSYKSLYETDGSRNEVYKITAKYFDLMALNKVGLNHVDVICSDCWDHINDFHCFEQTVMVAHGLLDKQYEQVESIKTEAALVECNNSVSESTECKVKLEPNEEFDEHSYNADKRYVVAPNDEFDEQPYNAEECCNAVPHSVVKVEKEELDDSNSKCLEKYMMNALQGDATMSAQNELIPQCDKNLESIEADKSQLTSSAKRSKELDNLIAQWKKKLECPVCAKLCSNFRLLKLHFRRHHSQEVCHVVCCGHKLHTRSIIIRHIVIHTRQKPFACKLCDNRYRSSSNLSAHMSQKHAQEGQLHIFKCTICQKEFRNKSGWKRHLQSHDTRRDYICKECGKGFVSDGRRKAHERVVHYYYRDCKECGQTIHGKHQYRRHLLGHSQTGKTFYCCDRCDAQFWSRHGLKCHYKSVHRSECPSLKTEKAAIKKEKVEK